GQCADDGAVQADDEMAGVCDEAGGAAEAKFEVGEFDQAVARGEEAEVLGTVGAAKHGGGGQAELREREGLREGRGGLWWRADVAMRLRSGWGASRLRGGGRRC